MKTVKDILKKPVNEISESIMILKLSKVMLICNDNITYM